MRWVLQSDAPTTVAFVEERAGNAHFQFMARGAADALFDPQPRPQLPAATHFLHFGSISLLQEPAATAITETVRTHRDRCVIVFDPNCRPALTADRAGYRARLYAEWFPLAHIVKISDQDLAWLEPGIAHADVAADILARGPDNLIVTRGEHGAKLFRRGHAPLHVDAVRAKVVDTVGAGDTFTAGLICRLLEFAVDSPLALGQLDSAQWKHVLAFAAGVAALNCTRAGCDPPMRAEMDPSV